MTPQNFHEMSLGELIRSHRTTAAKHRDQLSELLVSHDVESDAHANGAMAAMISEAQKWADMIEDGAMRDAGMIASLQRMGHYEIAVLGTLASWAKYLPDGSLDQDPDGTPLAGRVAGCIECHGTATGQDYMFTTDAALD